MTERGKLMTPDPPWLREHLKSNAAKSVAGIALGLGQRTYLCMGTVREDDNRMTWDAVEMAQ